MIVDNGRVAYYWRVMQLDGTTNGASGTVTVNIPTGVTLGSGVTLRIFNEQFNGDAGIQTHPSNAKTDYSSALKFVAALGATYTYNTPASIKQNGVTAAVAYSLQSPQAANTEVTATVTLKGTAGAAGKHSVSLGSTRAGLNAIAQTSTVTAGQNLTASPVTMTFTFAVPAENVDDLTLTHTFTADLKFTDKASYDVPAGTVNTAIKTIDVSGGVSGGTAPYTFTMGTAPGWLSITAAVYYAVPARRPKPRKHPLRSR